MITLNEIIKLGRGELTEPYDNPIEAIKQNGYALQYVNKQTQKTLILSETAQCKQVISMHTQR